MRCTVLFLLAGCEVEPGDTHDSGGGGDDEDALFVEDFLDTTRVDLAATTAVVDTAPPGLVHAGYWPVDDDVGDGADGDFVAPAGGTMPGGAYAFTSLSLDQWVQVEGDAVIRVAGDLEITGSLDVAGDLVLVVGGQVLIAGGVQAEGDLILHAPSAGGVVVGPGGYLQAAYDAEDMTGPPGDLHVRARGPVRVEGWLQSGGDSDITWPGGDLSVVAYGDVTFASGGWALAGEGAPGGALEIRTEGGLIASEGAWLSAPGAAGRLVVRAGGDLDLSGGSWMDCGYGGICDVVVEGDARIVEQGFVEGGGGPSSVSLTAASLLLDGSSFLDHWRAEDGDAGGDVTVRVGGPLTVSANSFLAGGEGTCAPAGDVLVEAAGDVLLDDGCFWPGESSEGAACGPSTGGAVTVRTGGALVVKNPDTRCPTVTDLSEGAAVAVTPDAELLREAVLVSLPLPGVAAVGETEVSWAFGAGTAGELLVSPTGGEPWVEPDSVTELPAGWRARATMDARLLDAAVLDRIVVR